MDNEKLERANSLRRKINSIDDVVKTIGKGYRLEIKSFSSNGWNESRTFVVENKYKKELIEMINKWRDEYQKEFDEL